MLERTDAITNEVLEPVMFVLAYPIVRYNVQLRMPFNIGGLWPADQRALDVEKFFRNDSHSNSNDISKSGEKQRFLMAAVATTWYRSFDLRLKKRGGYVGNIRTAKNSEGVRKKAAISRRPRGLSCRHSVFLNT